MTGFEAILIQLFAKEMAGHRQAMKVRFKYMELAAAPEGAKQILLRSYGGSVHADEGCGDRRIGASRPMKPYSVGYGRPPRHTQFKKGVSPNPRGRRKSVESDRPASVLRILLEAIEYDERGKRKTASRQEVAIRNSSTRQCAVTFVAQMTFWSSGPTPRDPARRGQ